MRAAIWAHGRRTWREVEAAIAQRDYVFAQQHPDGYWCGELEADSMLEADYIFMHTLLGPAIAGRMQRALTRDAALSE